MDTYVKEGQLYVQHQKFGKKWKKSWFVLYPASQNGIARLEFFDCGGGGSDKPSTKKLDKKIIRLSECISILPALTETCPKDNMAAFAVETNDKTHVFAAERNTSLEWVKKMCDIAFKDGSSHSGLDSNGQQDLQMAENLIYYSREEVNEFWVSVQRTEASERCGLQGSYWLKADGDTLILKEPKTKAVLFSWPYKLLRRYGRDKVMFSFEAGRRCDSGPGNFTFETKQGNEIFSLVEGAIREQKAQAEEVGGHQPDGDSGGSKPGSADGSVVRREGGDGGGKAMKSRSLPDPPTPVGGTPPRSPLPRGAKAVGPPLEEHVSLYSEPADSVRLPPGGESFYSDPVDSIKPDPTATPRLPDPTATPRLRSPGGDEVPRHPGNHHHRDPLYSGIYDHMSLELAPRVGALTLEGGAAPEHIYDEPEGRGVPTSSVLYDKVKPEPAWKRRDQEELQQGQEVNPTPLFGKQQPPPARSRVPKPSTAPKPAKAALPRKDPLPLPLGKVGANLNNNNSSWGVSRDVEAGRLGSRSKDLYSKVSRHKPCPGTWYPPANQRAPDIIYDNLGDI